MSRERTTTSYAILGLLTVQDWTTYELAKQVRRSLNWFWPRAERKLYDEPKRLADEGLVTASREHTGQRGRTVYRVTAAGRDALGAWLGEPPAPRSLEFEGMLKVFFADAGTKQQLLTTLGRIEDDAAQRLSTLTGYALSEMPFPRRMHLRALGLSLQYEQEAAVHRWATWAKDQVSEWTASDNPDPWDATAVLERLSHGTGIVTAPPAQASDAGD